MGMMPGTGADSLGRVKVRGNSGIAIAILWQLNHSAYFLVDDQLHFLLD